MNSDTYRLDAPQPLRNLASVGGASVPLIILLFAACTAIPGISKFVYGSGAFLPLLTNLGRLELLVWLSAYFVAIGWIIGRPGAFLKSIQDSPSLVAWPILACASFFWSLDPGRSIYDGIQLLMTVFIGFYLADRFSLNEVLKALLWALGAALILSLMVVVVSSAGKKIGGEWIGLFPHKNTLGAMSVILMMTAIALPDKRLWMKSFVAAMGLGGLMLLGSRSGTSILLALMILPLFAATFLIRSNFSFLPLLAGLAIVLATIVTTTFVVLEINPLHLASDSLGKSRNLSGRTILWDFGVNAFWDRPWIGHGYKGYWACCETTAGALKLTMKQRLASFHNNFIDVAVSFGVTGLVIFVLALVSGLRRSIAVWLRLGATENVWPLAFMLFLIVRCLVEYPLFANHGLFQLLFGFVMAKTLAISKSPMRQNGLATERRPLTGS
ncbi:MAG: O-antigen ligase family protein [Alphaproteobacteria bacterium]|nr:O-antigen ligase family protein [Alphaproteobacteria bacterium]